MKKFEEDTSVEAEKSGIYRPFHLWKVQTDSNQLRIYTCTISPQPRCAFVHIVHVYLDDSQMIGQPQDGNVPLLKHDVTFMSRSIQNRESVKVVD
jgi:hypothetical protein